MDDSQVKSSHIKVVTTNGVVTLTGSAMSSGSKSAAVVLLSVTAPGALHASTPRSLTTRAPTQGFGGERNRALSPAPIAIVISSVLENFTILRTSRRL